MITIYGWRLHDILKHRFKLNNYDELFEIWFDNQIAGSIFGSQNLETTWIRIENERYNRKFLKLQNKLSKVRHFVKKDNDYFEQSTNVVLELAFFHKLDIEILDIDKFYCIAVIPRHFQKSI